MEPIHKLSDVQRGWLLHELFPEEIPGLLNYVRNLCQVLREDEAVNRAAWTNQTYPFDRWLKMADETARRLDRQQSQLERGSRRFADQLFYGDNAYFMAYAMHLYATTQKLPNDDFTLLIRILFRKTLSVIGL